MLFVLYKAVLDITNSLSSIVQLNLLHVKVSCMRDWPNGFGIRLTIIFNSCVSSTWCPAFNLCIMLFQVLKDNKVTVKPHDSNAWGAWLPIQFSTVSMGFHGVSMEFNGISMELPGNFNEVS